MGSVSPRLRHKDKAKKFNRDELEHYIEASRNPKDYKDWEIALTNPASPIFKLFWSIVEERAVNAKFLKMLLDRLADTAYQERQKEIEQMLKDEISRAELIDKRYRELEKKVVKYIHENLEDASLKDLKKLATQLPITIQKLTNKLQKSQKIIVQKAHAIVVAQQTIQAQQAVLIHQFVQNSPPAISATTGQPIVLTNAAAASLEKKVSESGKLAKLLEVNETFSQFINESPAEAAKERLAATINLAALIHTSFAFSKADGQKSIQGSFVTKNQKMLDAVPQIKKSHDSVAQIVKEHKERCSEKLKYNFLEEELVAKISLAEEVNQLLKQKSLQNLNNKLS